MVLTEDHNFHSFFVMPFLRNTTTRSMTTVYVWCCHLMQFAERRRRRDEAIGDAEWRVINCDCKLCTFLRLGSCPKYIKFQDVIHNLFDYDTEFTDCFNCDVCCSLREIMHRLENRECSCDMCEEWYTDESADDADFLEEADTDSAISNITVPSVGR